jgi:HSP90 family molecular chaperone
MGEHLYENPYAFVRELAQNAIDTSRYRRYIERARGVNNFEPKPIQVTE